MDQTLYPKSTEIDKAIQQYAYKAIAEFKKIDIHEAERTFNDLYQNGKGLSGTKSLIKIGFSEERARNIIQEALENADIAKFLQPNKEVLILLEQIKNTYGFLDLITGSSRHNTKIKLAKLEIPIGLFTQIITDDEATKSDLSAFRLWFSFYPNLNPENFLYIGDRISSDYEKPKELGIRSILVNIQEVDPALECLQLFSIVDLKPVLL